AIMDRVPKHIAKRQLEKLNSIHTIFNDASKMTFLSEYLNWKYNNVLSINNQKFPLVVFPAKENQWTSLETVLSKSLNTTHKQKKDFLFYDSRHKDVLSKADMLDPSINKSGYVMSKIQTEPMIRLECEVGTYLDSISTSECLKYEILLALDGISNIEGNEKNFKSFDNKLKLRSHLHKTITNPLIDGGGRSSAIGVSTLIAYKENGFYNFLIGRRSQKGVTVYPRMQHVVPSSMFQSIVGDLENEYSITHNIFREYLEEIFNIKEEPRAMHFKYFYKDPNLEYLRNLLNEKVAKLYFTGIAIDLLNLRPEICTLLVIDTPDWYSVHSSGAEHIAFGTLKPITFCDEFEKAGECSDKKLLRKMQYIEKNSVDNYPISPLNTTPSGNAAFWLGLEVFKKVVK
ncbi:MAG: hypothetical protein KAJ24_05735, partial [Candidatus Aenigmarchaeota archaeon]|nr:hypothetical protein [Candidatus Aenigmarchaeota archaeon]